MKYYKIVNVANRLSTETPNPLKSAGIFVLLTFNLFLYFQVSCDALATTVTPPLVSSIIRQARDYLSVVNKG